MTQRVPAVATLLTLLAAGAVAQERVTIIANGVYDVTSLSYSQSQTFTEFVEQGSLTANYEADPGPGFDFGVQFSLYQGLGLVAGFSSVSRDTTGTLDASIPHPLYFDRPRSASAPLSGFGYSERALHLGVGWQGGGGSLGLAVFGGISLFSLKADAVDGVDFQQSFPFDEVTLNSPVPIEREDSPAGFHLGGRLDWRFAAGVGAGIQLRYSKATASFPAGGENFEVDAGGLQLAAGLRLYF